MKVLILKPSSLGDVIQALPVLRLIKRHHPDSEIHWWVARELMPLLEGDADLKGLIPFDRQHWGRPQFWRELFRNLREVRAQSFDWVIDLQGLARSALFGWFSRGKFTIGVDDPREGASSFYDLRVPRPSYETHAVDWYLHLLRLLGVPVNKKFNWLPFRPAARAGLERKWSPSDRRWVILNPGARWENKRWPAEYFGELARLLAAGNPEMHFAILGGEADRELGRIISAAAPERCLDLTGQTSLKEMVEWIRLGVLTVTNDTGPMHAAAAMKKPVVAIFGPTDPRRTGPYLQTEHILQYPLECAPCLKATCRFKRPLECMREIKPERVRDHVQRIWDHRDDGRWD